MKREKGAEKKSNNRTDLIHGGPTSTDVHSSLGLLFIKVSDVLDTVISMIILSYRPVQYHNHQRSCPNANNH